MKNRKPDKQEYSFFLDYGCYVTMCLKQQLRNESKNKALLQGDFANMFYLSNKRVTNTQKKNQKLVTDHRRLKSHDMLNHTLKQKSCINENK